MSDKAGVIDETVASVLEGKHPHKRKKTHSTLEAYNETPIFIPVDIMEDVIELFSWKISGNLGPGGTDL